MTDFAEIQELEQALRALQHSSTSGGLGVGEEPFRADVERGKAAAQGYARPLDNPDAQNLGRPVTVIPGVPNLVINVRGHDSESQMLTVCLFLVAPAYPTGSKADRAVAPDATAIITWGNGGVNTRARVDLRDGMQFSVCASTLRVEIDSAGAPGPAGPEPLQVSGFVSYGLRPAAAGKKPTLTFDALINHGATASFPIPDYAYAVEVFADRLAVPLTVTENASGVNFLQVQKLAADNSVRAPLVRSAFFLDVQNTDLAINANVSVVFEIDL